MTLTNCFIPKARRKTIYTRVISVTCFIITQKSDDVRKRQLKVSEHCKQTIVGISNMQGSGGGGGGPPTGNVLLNPRMPNISVIHCSWKYH